MSDPLLQVLGAGATTSVGLGLAATTAAIRAAVDNFQDTQFYDEIGEPLLGAAVPLRFPGDPDDETRTGGSARFGYLLSLAVEECLASAGVSLPLSEKVPLLLLGDDTRPGPMLETAYAAQGRCAHFFAQPGRLHMRAFTGGESSCIAALAAASRFIAQGAPHVLIASVDSWLNNPDVGHGLRHERFLTSRQTAGFIPGEAAAAILVGADTSTNTTTLRVRGLGLADEPATIFSDEPNSGKGLSKAIARALGEAGLSPHEMNLRLCDVAGEEYFFKESGYAWGRVLRHPLPPGYRYLQPATRVGHVGAAFGPLLIGYLWRLAQVDRLPGPHALIHLSSTHSLRGALVLSQRSH